MNVYQNDLDPSISHIACYYTSIAAGRQGYEWTAKDLNDLFEQCKQLRYIDQSNCIYSPQGVAKILGTDLIFSAKLYPGTYTTPTERDYIIGCWKLTPDAVDAHFVVMDDSGTYTKDHVIFDPWKGGSHTVNVGLCTSIRLFRRRI